MAQATTEKFEEMVLEVSSDSGSTWTRPCGLIDVTVTRSASVDTAEIPDCDDESKPLSIEKQIRAIEVSVSGTGVWAQESHETMMDWFYSAASLDCRVGNLKADTGDTEYETGEALLTSLTHSRTKGGKVTAEIELQFDGTPTRSVKAA